MLYRFRKTQSTIEYAALIVILAAVAISVSVYLKRASQGRMKQAADAYGSGMQYEK
ncbi:MAG: hypothetical protein K9L99_05895 [Candidatus Omnitrophica bacterium]|nr:hypothetical protein [Candidatus Omnitrophota bacterium]MCF7917242.1 hypothetical protein [Candidatus Omnitrophota bacterium]